MATHRHDTITWFDHPVHPAIGLAIFLVGFLVTFGAALALSAFLLSRAF